MTVTDLRLHRSLAKKVAVAAEYTVDFSRFNASIRKQILQGLENGTIPEGANWGTQARQLLELLARKVPVLDADGLSRLKIMLPSAQWESIEARALMLNLKLQHTAAKHAYLCTWRSLDGNNTHLPENVAHFEAYTLKLASKLKWRKQLPESQIAFIDAAAEAVRTKSTFTFKLEVNPDED